mgnify:CR=1 FL=1
MPELPEVETVVRYLKPDLIGQRIKSFESYWPKVLGNVDDKYLHVLTKGHVILDVTRRAKFIVMHLENGYIPIHLRMTGRLYPNDRIPDEKHISAVFQLSDKVLIFKDTRKFGRIYWYDKWSEFDNKHGLEPLGEQFTKEWLVQSLHSKKRQMKALLLDQHLIAGLGNIYVDEALWYAGIHPLGIASTISNKQSKKLHEGIQSVLLNAIAAKGTTIINFSYGDNDSGNYKEKLKIFGKTDQPCPKCGSPIQKIKVTQRGTHFCPKCQLI